MSAKVSKYYCDNASIPDMTPNTYIACSKLNSLVPSLILAFAIPLVFTLLVFAVLYFMWARKYPAGLTDEQIAAEKKRRFQKLLWWTICMYAAIVFVIFKVLRTTPMSILVSESRYSIPILTKLLYGNLSLPSVSDIGNFVSEQVEQVQ